MTTVDPHAEAHRVAERQAEREASEALLAPRTEQNDRQWWTIRHLLILGTSSPEQIADYMATEYDGELDVPTGDVIDLVQKLNLMRNEQWGLGRETLTTLALSLSLCPKHYVDYAICFDEDDPTCSQIRFIHPTHDT